MFMKIHLNFDILTCLLPWPGSRQDVFYQRLPWLRAEPEDAAPLQAVSQVVPSAGASLPTQCKKYCRSALILLLFFL